MKAFSNVNYAPLLTSEHDKAEIAELSPDDQGKNIHSLSGVKSLIISLLLLFILRGVCIAPSKPSSSRLQISILFGCVACTLTSLLLAGFALPVAKQTSNIPSGDANLPRPNQYIGLDLVDYSTSDFEPIVNFPPILTQVDSAHADFVFPDDSRRWLSWIGVVSPDDRHFLINSTVTSFLSPPKQNLTRSFLKTR